jgi:protein TonB
VNVEPSVSTFSLSRTVLAPSAGLAVSSTRAPRVFAGAAPPFADERRQTLGPILIVLLSAAVHVLLASWVSRPRGHDGRPFRHPAHVRITVARPPAPPKPVEIPVAVAPPPRPRALPVVRKRALAPVPAPAEQPKPETPPPPEPVLAATEAAEPDAVIGSAQGSVEGTGVVGGVKGGAPGAVAPPAPPPPVIQAHEGAGYLRNPRPPYPEMARARGWEGQVVLKVRVAASGRAEAVAIKRSSGRHLLDDAALEAVKGWTFVAATQGGVAIPGWVEVPLVFKLQ